MVKCKKIWGNSLQKMCYKGQSDRFHNTENIYKPTIVFTMIPKNWLLAVCLMTVFLPESLSENCNNIRKTLLEDNKENTKLLTTKMGATFPRQCLGDIINFSASSGRESALNTQEIKTDDVEIAMYEILKQVLHIFNQNHSKCSWDEKSLTLFKLGLAEQIQKLGTCINEEPCIEVKKFFDRMQAFLRKMEYSLCAWEIVEIEISQTFIAMNRLVRNLPEEGIVLEPEAQEVPSSENPPEAEEEEKRNQELGEQCNQMQTKLRDANKDNLELLDGSMKSTVARMCLNDIITFFSKTNEQNLPKLNDFQEKNVTEAIYEIIQQISTVFAQNNTQLSWDEDSITVFQLGLDQERELLQPCLKLGTASEKVKQEVMKDFKQINDLLKDKNYSQCAWEIAQIEIRRRFIMLNELIAKVPEEGPTELPDMETFMRGQLDEIAIRRKRRSSTSASRQLFL